MLRQYDVAVIITVIVERGLQFFCSFVSADDDRWLVPGKKLKLFGNGTKMKVKHTRLISICTTDILSTTASCGCVTSAGKCKKVLS